MARNSEQTGEEASAPALPQVVPAESLSASDIRSVSTGTGSSFPGEPSSPPSGVHVIDRSGLGNLNISDAPVVQEPGPSISVNSVVIDEPAADEGTGIKDKVRHKKLSKREKEFVVFGGVGSVNLLAVGIIGYFGWKRYRAGENGWKVIGIAVATFTGISAVQYLGVRYRILSLLKSLIPLVRSDADLCSAFNAWKVKKDKSQ